MNKKKKIGIISATLIAVACLSGGLIVSNFSAEAQSVAYITELFSQSSGISMESGATDKNGNKALALKAFKGESYVVLNEKTTGDYKFAFSGGAFDLTFASDKGTFSIQTKTVGATLSVNVEMNGKKGGVFYKNGIPSGNTQSNNRSNRFTEIVDTGKNYITFHAETMRVTIGNEENELLVWDFGKAENDSHSIGGTLFAFDEYSVTLSATASEEKVFVYEINGNLLETELLVDRAAPSVHAVTYSNAKSGEDYLLPTPHAFDLFDGEIKDIAVAVKRGNTVLLNGTYQRGMKLENPSIGEYEIVYSAQDESGNVQEKSITLICNSVEETPAFVSSYALENNTFGVGSSIQLPNIYYQSNYTNRNVPCALTVTFNGTVCENYDGVLLYQQTLTMEQAGTYAVSVKPIDENIDAVQTYTFTTVETLPSVQIGRLDVKMGDSLELPVMKTNFANTEHTYDTIVYYPDGKAYIGNTFEIDQAGQYTVEYRFDHAKQIYSYKAKFAVNETLYEFGKDSSYAYVGACTYDETQTGLNVFLSQGDTFTYSKVIDLSDNTKEDLMLELLMTPLLSGTQELQEFQVIFTDVHNPENYITLDFLDHKTMRTSCYAKIAHAGELLSGYENEQMNYHVNVWGTYFRTSLYGVKAEKDFPIKLWFDYAERKMYVSHGNLKRLISDLDDYNCYGNIWGGFTTGEVKMTIKGVAWLGSQAGMFLKTIDGEAVTSEEYTETRAPKIDLDLLGYEESNLPIAVVDNAYPVFSGTAFDAYVGEVKLHTNVYLNYGQATQTQVSVIDGKFIPYSSGRYTIVYTAYDNFGNRAEKSLTVDAVKNAPAIVIESLDSDSVSVGEKYYLPTVQTSGGSGSIIVAAYTDIDGKETLIDEYCIFDTAGVHNVKLVAKDYLGNTAEQVVEVLASYEDTPVFGDVPLYPDVLISGKSYPVQEFSAKYYADSIKGELARVRIYLEDKNGRTELTGKTFTPEVANSGDNVKLVYEATYDGKTNSYTYTIPTVIVNNGMAYSMDKYFSVTNGSAVATKDGVVLNITSNDSRVYYAQRVLADAFTINFDVNPEKNNVGAIVLWLYDAENKQNAVKIKIVNTQGAASLVSVNDGAFAEMKGSFVGSSKYAFELTYDNDAFVLKDADKFKKTVETNAYGETFNGFASGLVNFAITFEDVSGETEIIVHKINNQTVSSVMFDLVDPQAALVGGAYARTAQLGEVLTVKNIVYSDVLSLRESVTYSVTYNGKTVTSTDGKKLSNVSLKNLYSFACDNYGTYMIMYTITDDSGNSYYYSNVVNVVDNVAPIITISGDLLGEYKKGDKITLPAASATDNLNGTLTVFVAIYTPNGARIYLAPNAQYTFDQTGTYTVKYIVYDAIGNIAEQTFEMIVK